MILVPDKFLHPISARLPGLGISAVIALAAGFLGEHYGTPTMLLALLLGLSFHFLADDARFMPGIRWSAVDLLRIGVALLGARISFDQMLSLGVGPLILTPVLVVATMGLGVLCARLLGQSVQLGILVGGAVAICGASAALAIAAVLPKSETSERDTLFAIVAITGLSTLAMIFYPVLFTWMGLNETQIGYLTGATIHDVAQVVGAGYAVSEAAGDVAVLAKLMRVAMLPLAILALLAFRPKAQRRETPIPWFVVGFAAAMTINSLGLLPAVVVDVASGASRAMLITAIAALGIKTSIKSMIQLGPRYLALPVITTAGLLIAAIVALELTGIAR